MSFSAPGRERSLVRDWLLRPWRVGREPLAIQLVQVGIYLTLIVVGAAAVTDPPPASDPGGNVTVAMGVMLIVGGALAATALPLGQWWLERGANLILMGGVLAYGVALLHFDVGIGETVMRAGISLVVLLGLVIRHIHITGLWIDPHRPTKPDH